MPSFIVKPVRNRDEYVVWSTVVDAPTYAGSRDNLRSALGMGTQAANEARFERADRTGSSAAGEVEGWFGWDDEWFHLGNHPGASTASWRVHRSRLYAYATASDDDTAYSLAERVSDEEA